MKNKRNTTQNVTMQTWKIRRVYWGLNEPNYAFEKSSLTFNNFTLGYGTHMTVKACGALIDKGYEP